MDLGKVAALVIVASPRLPRQDLRRGGGGAQDCLSLTLGETLHQCMHALMKEGSDTGMTGCIVSVNRVRVAHESIKLLLGMIKCGSLSQTWISKPDLET